MAEVWEPWAYNLILFDVDGTLRDYTTKELLPGVREWFDSFGSIYLIALVTNQGGVGLRHWMERDKFGDPEKYPTEEEIRYEMEALRKEFADAVYVCFVYQSKKTGQWSPAPNGLYDLPEWNRNNRKPNPGMLLQACADFSVLVSDALMVGDSDEDELAANRANIRFIKAEEFFRDEVVHG